MDRTRGEFKARREMAGLSQQDISAALGVNIRTVKRWENPSFPYMPPEDAWKAVDDALDAQRRQVAYAVSTVEEQAERLGHVPEEVRITYYRDQAMYDKHGRDAGPVGQANADARAVAAAIEAMGVRAAFAYPVERAVKTPETGY